MIRDERQHHALQAIRMVEEGQAIEPHHVAAIERGLTAETAFDKEDRDVVRELVAYTMRTGSTKLVSLVFNDEDLA